MKSAAMEFGEYNITVNPVIPGLVDTALTRYEKRLIESMGETGQKPQGKPTPQEAWDVRAPTVPLKVGWLQPDDISPVAVFLASDAAAMVTGAEYEVTGGDSAERYLTQAFCPCRAPVAYNFSARIIPWAQLVKTSYPARLRAGWTVAARKICRNDRASHVLGDTTSH